MYNMCLYGWKFRQEKRNLSMTGDYMMHILYRVELERYEYYYKQCVVHHRISYRIAYHHAGKMLQLLLFQNVLLFFFLSEDNS